MKKGVLPLTLLLLAAAPKAPKAKGESYVLPLPLNENTLETLSTFGMSGNDKKMYSFAFYSASKRSDNSVVVWGFKINTESNIENYVEIFKSLENEYKTSINAYESIKANIPDFVNKVDGLETKLNNPSFTEKAENAKNFVENWNNQLPLNLDYSYDNKNDIEQFAKFVNTASSIKETYSNFKEISEFITEIKNTAADEETRNLAYSADESRASLESSWNAMSNSTDKIYKQVTDKNLKLPYADSSFEVFIRISFLFLGKMADAMKR